MKKCKEEGFLTGVCYAPTLPFISDTEEKLDRMIKTAKEYGAEYAFVGSLTLYGKGPADCRTLYYKFLDRYFPDLIPKYKSLFKIFFKPPKEYEDRLEETASTIRNKYGIKHRIVM
jgi:DNA repair photolyase